MNEQLNQEIEDKEDLYSISFWNNTIVHWAIIGNLVLNLGVIVLLVFYVRSSDAMIKLQYNVFFGTSLFVSWWQTYILPLICLLFFLVDLFVGSILYKYKERVAAYIVLLGALFTQISLIIAILSIIMNNF